MASNIVVPQLGESVVEARVARWLKKEGDAVTAGEPVVELETEKIDLEVGAEHTGVLEKIARQEGEDVKVGELLGTIAEGAARCRVRACCRSACASQAARSGRGGWRERAARRVRRRRRQGTFDADGAQDRRDARHRTHRRGWQRRSRTHHQT